MGDISTIVKASDVVVILAGAGMTADSLNSKGINIPTYSNTKKDKDNYNNNTTPDAFNDRPNDAWKLHGGLYNDYMGATPHVGYAALLEMIGDKPYFVVTSNVDGHFRKAGYDENNIYEVHGRMSKMQCLSCKTLWTYPKNQLITKIPRCPKCNAYSRPNIMLFNDNAFDEAETNQQADRFNTFMSQYDKGHHNLAIMEFGAGTSVTTIRMMSDFIYRKISKASLIRINPVDFDGPEGTIAIKKGALDAIMSTELTDEVKSLFFIE